MKAVLEYILGIVVLAGGTLLILFSVPIVAAVVGY